MISSSLAALHAESRGDGGEHSDEDIDDVFPSFFFHDDVCLRVIGCIYDGEGMAGWTDARAGTVAVMLSGRWVNGNVLITCSK